MYALYFDETFEPLGVFDSKNQAFVMGKLLSRERGRRVVAIFNQEDGSTSVWCKFEAGEQTFDGGCCPAPSATAAMEAMHQDDVP